MLCPAGDRYPEKQKIQATLKAKTEFELNIASATIKCNESVFKGETIKSEGKNLKLTYEVGTWTANKGGGECEAGGQKCAVKATGLPYAQAGITQTGEANGWITIEKGATFEVTCGTAVCIYGKSPLAIFMIGGKPAVLSMLAKKLERTAGSNVICAAEAELTTEYTLTEPAMKEVWVSQEP
jgi:hypothetical protein